MRSQVLGRVALAEGNLIESENLLEQCLLYQREEMFRYTVGWTLASLALVCCQSNDISQARKYLADSYQIAIEIQATMPLMYALPATALLLIHQEEFERSIELYALASRYPFVAQSVWFADIVGQHISAIQEMLQPNLVETALERGRGKDIWKTAEALKSELMQ